VFTLQKKFMIRIGGHETQRGYFLVFEGCAQRVLLLSQPYLMRGSHDIDPSGPHELLDVFAQRIQVLHPMIVATEGFKEVSAFLVNSLVERVLLGLAFMLKLEFLLLLGHLVLTCPAGGLESFLVLAHLVVVLELVGNVENGVFGIVVV